MLLECKGVKKFFGGLKALDGVDLSINNGELLGIIGPNGSGKTTLFNVITGFYRIDQGIIRFKKEIINNLKPYEIAKLGIARTFQIPRPFKELTVVQNVLISVAYGRGKVKGKSEALKKAENIVEFCGLDKKKNHFAENLNLGELRCLEIARALALEPELMLLDEVFAGLNPVETERALKLLKAIRELGITIMMIEHVMKVIMSIADRIVVFNHGIKIAEGTPKEVSKDEKVIETYLGKTYA